MNIQYKVYLELSKIPTVLHWKRFFKNMSICVFPFNMIANDTMIKCISNKTNKQEVFTFTQPDLTNQAELTILYNDIVNFIKEHQLYLIIEDISLKEGYKDCLLDYQVILYKHCFHLNSFEMKMLHVLMTLALTFKLIKPFDYEKKHYKHIYFHTFIDIVQLKFHKDILQIPEELNIHTKYEIKHKSITKWLV